MAAHTLRLRRTIPAPRERVFRAWTTPAELKRWSAPGPMTTPLAEVDLQVGGSYRIHLRAPDGTEHRLRGTYREVDPPRRLVYTWHWEGATDGSHAGETLVTVEFHERGRETEIVITHELFPSDDARRKHEEGWIGLLDKLTTVVA